MAFAAISGIRSLARNIVEAGAAGQLPAIQFPNVGTQNTWLSHLLDACDEALLLRRDELTFCRYEVTAEERGPQALWSVFDAGSTDEFLRNVGIEPLAVCFQGDFREASEWRKFIQELIGQYKAGPDSVGSRCIVVVAPCNPISIGLKGASVRHFSWWNPIKWEDARLLISEMIGWEANEAARAWMVASYAGACNLEPQLLQTLCQERPGSLSQIADLVFRDLTESDHTPDRDLDIEIGESERQWHVPDSLREKWSEGLVVGATLERGIRRPFHLISSERRKTMLDRYIWQEQVAGLLPLVMQVGKRANQRLDRVVSNDWRGDFARGQGVSESETYYAEPGPVLQYLRARKDVHIPSNLFDLLRRLVRVRNRLAHMEPVEKQDMQAVWDLDRRVQRTSLPRG